MELKQDRDRLAAIAEESPSPLIELDRASSLLYANPAMIALLSRFGYSLEGFPNVAPSRLPSIVEHCLKTGQTLQHEEVLLPEASFHGPFVQCLIMEWFVAMRLT